MSGVAVLLVGCHICVFYWHNVRVFNRIVQLYFSEKFALLGLFAFAQFRNKEVKFALQHAGIVQVFGGAVPEIYLLRRPHFGGYFQEVGQFVGVGVGGGLHGCVRFGLVEFYY